MVYKNKLNQPLFVVGVGDVEPNATFESDLIIESQNIELMQGSATPQAPSQEPIQTESEETE